jgi:hypothetical protein
MNVKDDKTPVLVKNWQKLFAKIINRRDSTYSILK